MRSADTEELWRRFGAGDGSAFSRLYSDHQHDVVRYCRSLLRDEEDARDAAQGTWTAIWASPDAARRDIPLRPWLFRVARNEAVSIIRRRRPHDPLSDLDLPALDDVAGAVELRDRLATLRADLLNLPERQRVALLSRELGGLGHAEIAEGLGISTAAAKQTIYEARRALVEAESGRSMACDQVQRALSDGDGRVRRGRRLGAHLRGCASCRTFADAVGRRRRDLRLLFPAPATVGLLARAAAGLGAGGAGAGAGGSVVAAGGSVATKLTVAVALVAAAGVGGHHEITRGDAGGATAPRVAAGAPAATRAPVPAATPGRSPGATGSAGRPRPATPRARPARGAPAPPKRARRRDPAAAAAPLVAAPAGPERGPGALAQAKAPGRETPPGLAKKPGAEPPGQGKKIEAAVPPGQAKKTGAAEPPGQAKKTGDPAGAAPPVTAPPPAGEAPAADPAPGQAKKTIPPGQAKK